MPSSTRLADAGAGEQADALAAADGEHRVDRAHAGVERRAHRVAVHRVDRAARQRLVVHLRERAHAVDRLGRASRRRGRAGRRRPAGGGVRSSLRRHGWRAAPSASAPPATARHDARAARQAVHVAGRHQVGAVAEKPTTSATHRRLAAAMRDLADRADRHADAGRLEHEPGDAHQQSLRLERHRVGGEAAAGRRGSAATLRGRGAGRRGRASHRGCRRRTRFGRGRVAACHASSLPSDGRGAAPAAVDAGVDQADVGVDQAAAARDRRVGEQPRAACRQHFGRALRRRARGRRGARAA